MSKLERAERALQAKLREGSEQHKVEGTCRHTIRLPNEDWRSDRAKRCVNESSLFLAFDVAAAAAAPPVYLSLSLSHWCLLRVIAFGKHRLEQR
jgi:hypothetical protein